MEKGVNQKKKIVLGLPLFGNAWSLANAKNNGMFAPAKGAPSSYPTGVISYEQITKFLAKIDTTQKFDPDTETHYCYNSTTWISYDDRKSITKKIEHARDLELLGYFVWHVGNDHNWILSKTAADEWGEKRLGAEAYDIVVSSDVEAFVSR
ncbi:Chitinase-3-like protein 2 [Morella rubra]|uniref:Chitinase-3-like protein 2 n=1 Tax=Morella rubra TaxID=262757 RepID=A0A6A1WSB2_9ROSI|nr:Chitinase-3-like protein 2 [Morella rubra]